MYPVFHSLAEWQDVNIGSTYKTPDSAWLFTHFIAKSQRQIFLSSLSSNPFFSFLVDGSTDSGNIEQELVFVLCSYKDDTAKEIHSRTRYLSVVSPTSSDTLWLVNCLGKALSEQLGISLKTKGVFWKQNADLFSLVVLPMAHLWILVFTAAWKFICNQNIPGYFGLGASPTVWS